MRTLCALIWHILLLPESLETLSLVTTCLFLVGLASFFINFLNFGNIFCTNLTENKKPGLSYRCFFLCQYLNTAYLLTFFFAFTATHYLGKHRVFLCVVFLRSTFSLFLGICDEFHEWLAILNTNYGGVLKL